MRRASWPAVWVVVAVGLLLAGCDGPSRGRNTQPSSASGFFVEVTASPNVVPATPVGSDADAGGCANVTVKVFDTNGNLVDGATVNVTSSLCCFAGETETNIVGFTAFTIRGFVTRPFCGTDVRGTALITASVQDATATTLITVF